jgi:Flp pilus assembly protein TadB
MAVTIIVALGGALAASGLVLALHEIFSYRLRPGIPSRPVMIRVSPATSRRVVIAIVVGLVAQLVSGWPVLGLAAAAGVFMLPQLSSARESRRRTAVLEGLGHWARRLSDLLGASRGLEDALEASARSAPEAIAKQVTALASGLAARTGSDTALRAFANEIDDPVGDRVVAALIIATGQRGGAVGEILRTLAEQVAKDVASRRDIDAERAEHRTTLRWVVGIVIAFTLFCMLNRAFSEPFGTLAGQLVLAVIGALYIAGLAWLQRLGNVRAPARFLAGSSARPLGAGRSAPASHARVVAR